MQGNPQAPAVAEFTAALLERLTARKATIGVVGLGYVGLPLAVGFADAGHTVVGFDVDASKTQLLSEGKSHIPDVPAEEVARLVAAGRFSATTDDAVLAGCDAIAICVPTPLNKTRDPDLSFVVSAVERVAKRLRKGQLIVLESTTWPGTTVEVVAPMLERTGLVVGADFHLAFSPERIDPGNAVFQVGNTPKVVGGMSPACSKAAEALYACVTTRVVSVSSPTAAEMVKILENTFRAVNIGLVNETAVIANKLGLDIWEIIDAAATKPFGFMPFWPGPGLGGHCIPIDPHYLSWKLRAMNYRTRFIEVADDINNAMPNYVVERVALALNDDERSLKGSRILVLGAAYKRDITDWRESPAIPVIEGLLSRGAKVEYQDDFVPKIELHGHDFVGRELESVALDYSKLGEWDCVVVITDHRYFDRQKLLDNARRIVDTRNLLGDLGKGHPRVTRL
ncbi:MAG: nucleotide sugar dehydrogenase [Bradymonadia bacterium]